MRELFKPERNRGKVFVKARILLGKEPMLDYAFSKKYTGKDGRLRRKWEKYVMLTERSQGDVAKLWAEVGSEKMVHDGDVPKVCCGPAVALHMTPDAQDIMYTVDGITVYVCRDVRKMGNLVFAAPGEVLPTYVHVDCNSNPCSKDVSKHHYIMITGPSGVLGCFAMKSGTSLWGGKVKRKAQRTDGGGAAVPAGACENDFMFWWDYIPLLLEARHLPGGRDPHEVCEEMANRTWLVRA